MFDVLPAFVSRCISRRERRHTVKSERYCPALLVSPISFRPMSPATDGRSDSRIRSSNHTPSTTTVMTSNLSHDDLVLPGLDLLMKYCEMCVGVGVGASGPIDSGGHAVAVQVVSGPKKWPVFLSRNTLPVRQATSGRPVDVRTEKKHKPRKTKVPTGRGRPLDTQCMTPSEVTGWRSNLIAPIFSSTMRTNFGVSSPLEHYSP